MAVRSVLPNTSQPAVVVYGPTEGSPAPTVPLVPTVPHPQTFRLARSCGARLTPIARWARDIARRCGLSTDAVGTGTELDDLALAELQRRTQDAFTRPVYRITLADPLLAFRFYGDLCVQLSELYTSLATVVQVPCWGAIARGLLGLTGRNGADQLVAVRLAPGSVIAAGGISNRAVWADQILVEASAGVTVIACISQAEMAC